MARTVGIGIQYFEQLRERNVFYVDKTDFIRERWESSDAVTLITRPRRFGKTLNLPVIFISFAGSKETSFPEARKSICRSIEELYNKHDLLLEGNLLNEKEKEFYQEVSPDMPDSVAAVSLRSLSDFIGGHDGHHTGE